MNSRAKGARGERQWRDELRANGYDARRGQQFSGSPDSPDVVCAALPWVHFEVKAVERLNIEEAMEQARRDCGVRNAERGIGGQLTQAESARMSKVPIVAHKRNHRPWLVTMEAETFFRLLRMDFPTGGSTSPQRGDGGATDENTSSGLWPPSPQRGEGRAIHVPNIET